MQAACALGGALGLAAAAASPALAQMHKRHGAPPPQQQGQPADPNAPKPVEYETPFPTKMDWVLANMNGKAPPAEATMKIDDNYRGTGSSGCNTWSASLYPVKGHRLAMGPVAQTKRSCAADVMTFERAYLTILHSGPNWEQTGSTLTVRGPAGTLVFNRGL